MPNTRSLPRLLPLLILTLAAAGFAGLYLSRPRSAAIEVPEKVWAVATETVQQQRLAPSLSLYGRVENPRATRLSAALAAEVLEVHVREGDAVDAGALLVRLDERDAALALTQREAEVSDAEAAITLEHKRHAADQQSLQHEERLLALSRKAVERERQLLASKLGSEARLDDVLQAVERQALAVQARRLAVAEHDARLAQLQARLERARALRDQARLDRGRTAIRAPFAARITEVNVSPGDRVRVGDRLLGLVDSAGMELRAQIPAARVTEVQAALAGGARLLAEGQLDGQSVSAALERLAAQTETGRGGVDALLRVTGGEATLQLGRTVELWLHLPPQAGVVAVPAQAIYGTDRVYKLVDGRMAAVEVEAVGEYRDGGASRYLVRSAGLRDGEQLIVTPLPNAVTGLRVESATR